MMMLISERSRIGATRPRAVAPRHVHVEQDRSNLSSRSFQRLISMSCIVTS
jgi:hypothetical protein